MQSIRVRQILSLALPIIGGMVSQNLLNLIDTGMVGSLGDAALAAVGTGSFLNFLSIAFVTGLSAGVQAMSSRRKGENRLSEMALPLNGALLVAIIVSVPLCLILASQAKLLFSWVNDSAEVLVLGESYYRVRLFAMAAVGMNFAFRGYWNGISRPGLYMMTLVIMHVTNIFLNWVFIFGNLGAPALGAYGAGLATTLSTYLGTFIYLIMGWRLARPHGFLAGIPNGHQIANLLRLAVPNGIQQMFFAGGFTVLFWILGQVGTATASAANVLINVVLVAILPGIALGIASASLVGQALGRNEPDEAKQWGWDVVKVGIGLLCVLGIPMWAFPRLVLGIFLHNPETLELAIGPLRLVGLTIWLDGMGLVLLNALLGAGDARRTMIISVFLQWFVFLPVAYLVGPYLGWGLMAIWIAQVGYRAIQAGVFAWIWHRGDWVKIKV